VAVIIITGVGRGFSAGADLAAALDNPLLDDERRTDLGALLERHYNPLILRMRDLPKPIVAAVNGMAAGAGASLASAADLTIAARSVSLLQSFVNIGLIPDAGGTWFLPQALGTQCAMGLALLGEKLSAQQALEWGLILDVVDDEEVLPAALTLAQRLAAMPPKAVARIKYAIRSAVQRDLESQLQIEAQLQRECSVTHAFEEGVAAFMQKRKAVFTGH